MQTSSSFFDVFRQYFSEGIMPVLITIALLVLIREWNNKKVVALISVVCASIILLFNELVYRVLVKVGEGSTYYRFFWICPVVLLTSYLVIKILSSVEAKKKNLLIILMGLMLLLFSARQASDWLHFPANLYQMDEDVIQVADTLMKLTDGEPTYLFDNGDLEDTIRQYDARIKFTRMDVLPLDAILKGLTTNMLGIDVQTAIYNNRSRYLALRNNEVLVYKVLESAGISLAAETDNYKIYHVDYDQLYYDWRRCEDLKEGYINQINIEYIPISGLTGEYKYIYISDFGTSENEEVYMELIEKINLQQPDGVIINDQLSVNANWYQKEGLLDDLKIPYYCNNQELQLIEQEEFNICMIDNTKVLSDTTLKRVQTIINGEKSVILVLSDKLEEQMSELYTIISEASSVVQVLSAQKAEYSKELIGEDVLQFALPVDENQIFNMVYVKGLEE